MKSFRQYLIPSVISSIFLSAFVLIDGIFIGTKLMDAGLAAINIAWPITAFIQALGIAIGMSGGIYITRLYAKNEINKANSLKSLIIIILLIAAIILCLLIYALKKPLLILLGADDIILPLAIDYLTIILIGGIPQVLAAGILPLIKNSGLIKQAFIASLAAIITNLCLDYLFVIILDWSLAGAALASVIGQALTLFLALIFYAKELKLPKPNLAFLKEIIAGAIAPFILNYSYSFIIIITNIICMYYGGSQLTAAYTLLSYLLYISSAAAQGVADAIQPLFSYNFEIKNSIIYKLLNKCIVIALVICSILSILYLLFQDNLAALYNLSSTAKELYIKGIIPYFIGFVILAIAKVSCSFLYSIGNKKSANFLVLLEPIALTPLIYLIICPLFKIDGIWYSFLIIQILLSIISIVIIINSRRKIVYEWNINNKQA